MDEGANVRATAHMKRAVQMEGVEIIRGDLTDWDFCMRASKDVDYVFHLAAMLSGIIINSTWHADVFTKNLLMNTKTLEAARQNGVERILFASAGAVYPDRYAICKEEYAWTGAPESSNTYYGYAKLIGETQTRAYHYEHGIQTSIVRIAGPYGPWDNFDPTSSFALQSFIRRGLKRENPFVIFGSGQVIRDYIYVSDVANAILLALEKYACGEPLNVGSGKGVRLADAANLITEIVGYEPKMMFDLSKPDGRPVRILDISKANSKIGFTPKVSLKDGLRKTIEWCKAHPESLGV